MYVQPLRLMEPPIIPRERLETFIQDIFHNFGELCEHHKRLLDRLFEIQMEEHPIIGSITVPIHDLVSGSRNAYLKYISNYPFAVCLLDDEMTSNPQFKTFVEVGLSPGRFRFEGGLLDFPNTHVTGFFRNACDTRMRVDWI